MGRWAVASLVFTLAQATSTPQSAPNSGSAKVLVTTLYAGSSFKTSAADIMGTMAAPWLKMGTFWPTLLLATLAFTRVQQCLVHGAGSKDLHFWSKHLQHDESAPVFESVAVQDFLDSSDEYSCGTSSEDDTKTEDGRSHRTPRLLAGQMRKRSSAASNAALLAVVSFFLYLTTAVLLDRIGQIDALGVELPVALPRSTEAEQLAPQISNRFPQSARRVFSGVLVTAAITTAVFLVVYLSTACTCDKCETTAPPVRAPGVAQGGKPSGGPITTPSPVAHDTCDRPVSPVQAPDVPQGGEQSWRPISALSPAAAKQARARQTEEFPGNSQHEQETSTGLSPRMDPVVHGLVTVAAPVMERKSVANNDEGTESTFKELVHVLYLFWAVRLVSWLNALRAQRRSQLSQGASRSARTAVAHLDLGETPARGRNVGTRQGAGDVPSSGAPAAQSEVDGLPQSASKLDAPTSSEKVAYRSPGASNVLERDKDVGAPHKSSDAPSGGAPAAQSEVDGPPQSASKMGASAACEKVAFPSRGAVGVPADDGDVDPRDIPHDVPSSGALAAEGQVDVRESAAKTEAATAYQIVASPSPGAGGVRSKDVGARRIAGDVSSKGALATHRKGDTPLNAPKTVGPVARGKVAPPSPGARTVPICDKYQRTKQKPGEVPSSGPSAAHRKVDIQPKVDVPIARGKVASLSPGAGGTATGGKSVRIKVEPGSAPPSPAADAPPAPDRGNQKGETGTQRSLSGKLRLATEKQ